ncbi:MAG TPA: hypothetical protein VJ922_06840 [Actinomycetota bacterium]|nr:hypothetical protein [Actinomycetota bacterium]
MDEQTDPREISRRKALKRAGVIGALVWVPPVVSSFRLPAAAQVGSPAPTPTPSETPTTPPTEEPAPTPTATVPAATPSPEVLGSGTEVSGEALAETGQALTGPSIAGVASTAIGFGLRAAGKKPAADEVDPE